MYSVPMFMQGIEMGNAAYDYTHNFCKLMVLYRLLGGRPNISISVVKQEDSVGFEIKAKTMKDAEFVNKYINGTNYTVYGTQYGVTSVCEKKTISFTVKKN